MILKPLGEEHNKRVKYFADALFKKQKSKIEWTPRWKYILMPRKFFSFFLSGPSKELLANQEREANGPIRMIKAEEDAYQSMWEEAANHSFDTGLVLLTSSDNQSVLTNNLQNVTSAYSIYTEQYLNEIVESNIKKMYSDDFSSLCDVLQSDLIFYTFFLQLMHFQLMLFPHCFICLMVSIIDLQLFVGWNIKH
jgi:hypothetical protein